MQERTSELTQAIALGSAEALAQFYHEWFDWMYAAARSITRRDEAFCLDIVQDSMLRVIKSIRRFEKRDDLERWLATVVKRAAIDRMRSDGRRAARDREAAANENSGPVMRCSAEEREWLTRAVQGLHPDDQELLVARHRFEWTLAQIAKLRGGVQSPGSVHGRISRVLAQLRREAREAFGGA